MRTSLILALITLLLPLACGVDSTPGDGGDDLMNVDSGDTTSQTDPTGDPTGGPGTTTGSTGPTGDTEPGTDGSTGVEDTTTGGSSSGGEVDQLPPTNGAELVPWLETGEYQGWTRESGIHPSAGPHNDGVLTFVNDALLASLETGDPAHPQGAATVKELYDAGGTRLGWAVMVKIQPDSAAGDGWYWYEVVDGNVYADGTGEGICTGCHSGGTDYVLTPFPLQ